MKKSVQLNARKKLKSFVFVFFLFFFTIVFVVILPIFGMLILFGSYK